ncbi:twin-arginine translocase subunit TatC [Candidatus Fermentibacteria bacterium]|nr:twin-arginine translocase subunit TatC [Candidatus Fermentibacteria bacterium]
MGPSVRLGGLPPGEPVAPGGGRPARGGAGGAAVSEEGLFGTFWDHLEELRRRLLYSLLAVSVCTVGGIVASKPILKLILATGPENLQTLSPPEAFAVHLKVSLVCGLIVASPVVFYQFWRFVSPGLYRRERRVALLAATASAVLFLVGVALAWSVLLRPAVEIFRSFEEGAIIGNWSLSNYVSFLGGFVLVFGLAFQLPLLVMLLVKLGVVSPSSLGRYRSHVLVALLVAAAFLTPPDPMTQVALALPLYLLFEGSALLARLAGGRGNARSGIDQH